MGIVLYLFSIPRHGDAWFVSNRAETRKCFSKPCHERFYDKIDFILC